MSLQYSNPTADSQFEYFDQRGLQIGQTQGKIPDQTIFEKAHYVVKDSSKMIKNEDSSHTIKSDIEAFKNELITVPVSNMTEIMHLNKIICALTQFLDDIKSHQEAC